MKSKAAVRLDFAKNNLALAALAVWQSFYGDSPATMAAIPNVLLHSVKIDISYVKTG